MPDCTEILRQTNCRAVCLGVLGGPDEVCVVIGDEQCARVHLDTAGKRRRRPPAPADIAKISKEAWSLLKVVQHTFLQAVTESGAESTADVCGWLALSLAVIRPSCCLQR